MTDTNLRSASPLPGVGRLAAAASLTAISVAVLESVAWILGMHPPGGGLVRYIPMAPSTALCFIVLGTVALLQATKSSGKARLAVCLSAITLVMLFALMEVPEYWGVTKFDLEHLLLPNYGGVNGIPLARMSPLTAAFFVLLGGAMLSSLMRSAFDSAPTWLGNLSGVLGSIVGFAGFTILLGYIYGTPFLYGEGIIPVAATTAAAFLFLGIAVLTRLEPHAFPTRYFAGSPIHRRLVQAFVPLVFFAMLLQAIISRSSPHFLPVNEALLSALLAGSMAILAIIATSRTAAVVSHTIDQAERALRESEERYRAVFDNAALGIGVVDRSGRFLSANSALQGMLGYTSEELQGLTVFDLTHPDDIDVSQTSHYALISGELPPYRLEKRYVNKNGTVFWADLSVSAMYDSEGRHAGNVGVISDITDRKTAQDIQRLLATAIEQSTESVMITDRAGNIQYVNPAFEHISGYDREHVIGHKPRFLKSDKHDMAFYKEMATSLRSGKPWKGRMISKRKDGELFHEDVTISPVRSPSGQITNYVDVGHDVTQQVQLERQLFQAQKMEAIGTLAGGIAHDFNNLLQVILGYSDLLLEGAPERGDEHELQAIRQAATRGADLVKQILTFSRRVETNPRPINLNHEVTQAHKLLTRVIPKMIDIQLFLADDLKGINADPGQIEQVLLNMAANAQHAMPEGGKLVIQTKNATLDADYCSNHLDVKPGPYVMLTISDSGHGMEKYLTEHIFEPFFTTKKMGDGTGLGLAMVFGIIKGHGGNIECYSELAQGTTFRIYLPAIELEEAPAPSAAPGLLERGTETVLLVDDEELILELGNRILTKAGYTVITAGHGKEALEVYRSKQSEISLVILDLIMPGMGGRQCLDALVKVDPEVRVLIASGYSPDRVATETAGSGAAGFIGKPYRVTEMLHMVREVLDAEGQSAAR